MVMILFCFGFIAEASVSFILLSQDYEKKLHCHYAINECALRENGLLARNTIWLLCNGQFTGTTLSVFKHK